MENEQEKTARIPEGITIGGVTYTVKDSPELQQFIQGVAKVEKQKVYSQIENIKQRMDSLNGVVVEQVPTFDAKEIVEQLKGTFLTREDIQGALQESIKEVVQPLLSTNEQKRIDELNAFRESVIKQNETTCIPDLVIGNTKEEIEAALKGSIAIRQKYFTPATETQQQPAPSVTPAVNPPTQTASGIVTQPAVSMSVNRTVTPDSTYATQVNVKAMSAEAFKEERANLKAQIANMFPDGKNV